MSKVRNHISRLLLLYTVYSRRADGPLTNNVEIEIPEGGKDASTDEVPNISNKKKKGIPRTELQEKKWRLHAILKVHKCKVQEVANPDRTVEPLAIGAIFWGLVFASRRWAVVYPCRVDKLAYVWHFPRSSHRTKESEPVGPDRSCLFI